MHVVATAGHVDHGKSTLLHALTGQDPDRLAAEKKRGLSIELGYVWCEVAGAGEVAFVDVPGHQRFVTTALCGLGQVPVVLFVVATDDPWMPQADEHLRALDALGVDRGLLVATRADLADAGPALARARERLQETSLAGVPEVAVSARTGAGMDLLRAALAEVLAKQPPPVADPSVRLWVDRQFSIQGAGTIVTGTLESGTLTVGDDLETHICGGVRTLRVRAIESLGRRHEAVSGTARVALELAGRAVREVGRGDVLATPGSVAYTDTVDVRLRGANAAGPPRPPRGPLMHLRASSSGVRLRLFDDQNARIQLPRPLPLRVGDRALLRDPGSRSVWGITVLDPAPPPSTGRGFARRRATGLESLDLTTGADLELRGMARRDDYRRWFAAPRDLPADAVLVDEWALSARRAHRVAEDLAGLVVEASAAPTITSVARTLGLPERVVERLAPPSVRVEHGRWVSTDVVSTLSDDDRAALDALAQRLHSSPFAAPDAPTLDSIGLDERRISRLHRSGDLLRVAPGVVLLPGADEAAMQRLAELEQPFTTSLARRHLGSSRRATLGLLGYLDRTGRTVRLADDTRRLRG